MSIAVPPSLFEPTAEALVQTWLVPGLADDERARLARQTVDGAAPEQRQRLTWLSEGLRALRVSITHHMSGGRTDLPTDGLERLAGVEWPRAHALYLAALSRALDRPGDEIARSPKAHLERMLAHAARMPGDWPAAERLWFEIALVELLMRLHQPEDALERARQLLDLRFPAALDELCRGNVAATVSSLLITLGDMDSALECLDSLIDEREAAGRPALGLSYNALLARGLLGDIDGALRHIQSTAWLRECRWPDSLGGLTTLTRWIRAQAGEDVPPTEAPPAPGLSPVQVNETWMHAELVLRQGDPGLAAKLIQAQLVLHAESAQPPSPVNGMHLLRVLSDAELALDRPAAALASLRASHAHAYRWGLRATAVRLRMLEHAAQRGSSGKPPARAGLAQAHRHIAHVSHELRNPLAAAIGMLDLLAGTRLDELQQRRLNLARHAARTALTLCDDLVTLGRLEAGAFEVRPQPCDAAAIAAHVVALQQPIGRESRVSLRLEQSGAVPARLMLDPVRLEQLMLNLTGNAMKFTRQGEVRLLLQWRPEAAGAGGRLRVEVHDSGPGIEPDELPLLFGEFTQTEAGRTLGGQGSGLGLALCGRLVEVQGGTIGADSQPARGSVFWFELPSTALA